MFTDNKTAELKREYVDNVKMPPSPSPTARAAPSILIRQKCEDGEIAIGPPVPFGTGGPIIYLSICGPCSAAWRSFAHCASFLLYHYCTILAGRSRNLYGAL